MLHMSVILSIPKHGSYASLIGVTYHVCLSHCQETISLTCASACGFAMHLFVAVQIWCLCVMRDRYKVSRYSYTSSQHS